MQAHPFEIELDLTKLIKPVLITFSVTTLITAAVVGANSFFNEYYLTYQSPIVFQSPVLMHERKIEVEVISVEPERVEQKEPEATTSAILAPIGQVQAREIPQKEVFSGKVSYYSHDGCIGCSEGQIMANGEPFDESAMTLAFNKLPLNTKVLVTNEDNGKSVEATVTDTGGFEKYNRIADLSKGLCEALECVTDNSTITIEEL